MKTNRFLFAFPLLVLAVPAPAWDFDGHRAVNQLALASLPAEFPDFVRAPATAERIAWLSGEPDRWRSAPDLPARHGNVMDHFLDLEELAEAGLSAETVSSFRYEFAVQFAAGRAAHPENFPRIDPAKNGDRTREWCGFLPWTIVEYFGKLRGNFGRLKVFEEFGMADEAARTRESIAEIMGVMGHFVGDAAQPLHTTVHYNGWTGANPRGFTTSNKFHAWIDGGFIARTGPLDVAALRPRLAAAEMLSLAPQPSGREPAFALAMDYVLRQNRLVVPLYELEKAGKLKGDDPADTAGRKFIEDRLLEAGHMLGSLWFTAWRAAAPDAYLRGVLLKQQADAAATAMPAKS